MKGIFLVSAEFEALHGAGPLSAFAYLWLRTWVDIRTGVVGLSRPISLAMIRAYCETHVPKGAGVHIVQASERNVRTALASLERAGLIRRLPGDRLIFRLLLAQLLPLAQIKPDVKLTGSFTEVSDAVDNPVEAVTGARCAAPGYAIPTRNQRIMRRPNPTHIRDRRNLPSHTAAISTAPCPACATPVAAVDERQLAIAMLLNKHGVVAGPGHPVVQEWAVNGVRDADLLTAISLAKKAREEAGSVQPINLGFIRAKLNKVIGQEKQGGTWWASIPTMEARAHELKIPGARPGESMDEFKARIWSAQSSNHQSPRV